MFANSYFIIVAAAAGAAYIGMIKPGAFPCPVSVAVIASVIADNMFIMFARGEAVVMALCALKRCALVLSANVAAGAVQILMTAGQREPGRKMIKAVIFVCSIY